MIASQATSMTVYVTLHHLKMALGPKHVVAVTTEEEEEVFPLTVSL
jgi:hypothetical protein